MTHSHTWYGLNVILSAMIAAVSLVVSEIAMQYFQVPPLLVAVIGNFTGGVILLLMAMQGGEPVFPRERRTWRGVLAVAVFIYTLAYLCSFSAIGDIGAGKTALLGQLETLFAVLFAIIFLGERLTPRRVVAALILMVGAVLINFDLQLLQLQFGWGELLAVLAPMFVAGGIVISKPFLDVTDARVITGLGLTIGSLFLIPVAAMLAPAFTVALMAVPVIMFAGTMRGLSWFIYNRGLRHIGVSLSAILFISFGFFTVLLQLTLGHWFPVLGLQIPSNLPAALLGAGLIAVGIMVLQSDRRK